MRIEREAKKERISLGEVIRRALEKYLLGRTVNRSHDSFLGSTTVLQDEGPIDVSERHDEYLLKKGAH